MSVDYRLLHNCSEAELEFLGVAADESLGS